VSTSTENYLETILILSRRNAAVRAVDIAEELDYTKPSVSVAMKNLRKDGCIDVDRQGYISLTPRGQEIAESMYERHVLLSDWLISLGVPSASALEDACRIEHVISPESFDAIKNHYLKYK
jgi:Mn-dependent DtxR family transcriptional regulator